MHVLKANKSCFTQNAKAQVQTNQRIRRTIARAAYENAPGMRQIDAQTRGQALSATNLASSVSTSAKAAPAVSYRVSLFGTCV